MKPQLSAARVLASLLVVVAWCCFPPRVVTQEAPSLKAREVEKRLKAVQKLVYGDKRQPLPPAPWTTERLEEFITKFSKQNLETDLKGTTDPLPISLEYLLNHNTVNMGLERLALFGEKPPRDGVKDQMVYADSWMANYQLLLQDLAMPLSQADRYVKYTNTCGGISETRDREMIPHLTNLETSLRTRLMISRVIGLQRMLAKEKGAKAEILKERLASSRALLPADYKVAELPALQKRLGELEIEFRTLAGKLNGATNYLGFVLERYTSLSEQQKKMKGGAAKTDRRELQRLRAQTAAEMVALKHSLGKWNLDVLRLCAFQGNFDRPYGQASAPPQGFIKLGDGWDNVEQYYRKMGPEVLKRFRDSLKAAEANIADDGGFAMGFEDWWVRNARDLAPRLVDGLLDDMTTWLESLPATRRTVKDEVRHILGFPAGKAKLEDLTKEEQKKVQDYLRKSTRQALREFNRETIFVLRKDIDLFEAMLKSYPPRDLVMIKSPSWSEEPKARLTSRANGQ